MATNAQRPAGELLAEISNMVVKIHADFLGRGPTKARTYTNENIITCLLEDTLTRTERTLMGGDGNGISVMEIRAYLLAAMSAALVAGVETLTERPVAVLVNGTNIDPDMTSHVFVLGVNGDGAAPAGGD